MTFAVRYSASARDDLKRLYEHLLQRATHADDLDLAERALGAIVDSVDTSAARPSSTERRARAPFLRELLIPFGSSGYVALFEIEDASTVTILAVRHQLEDDYH